MRKRSEANPKKIEPKPSAETRTASLPLPDNAVVCGLCDQVTTLAKCTLRANGVYECPSCGAVIDPESATVPTLAQAAQLEVKPEAKPEAKPVTTFEAPPKTYCGEDGTERPIVGGQVWKQCHPTTPDVGDSSLAANRRPQAGSPAAMITGRTLTITRGRHTFPTVAYGSIQVGHFTMSAELGADADVIEVARRIRADLEKIADEAFAAELKWYEEKFNALRNHGG